MDIQSPLIDTIEKDDIVIVGGGGLMNFNETWNHQINVILEKSDNVIGWGLGFNTHYDYERMRLNVETGLHFLKNKSTESDDTERIKAKMIDILNKIKNDLNVVENIFDHY